MATMTFLATFEGDLSFQSADGPGSLALSGSATYDADAFPGTQAIVGSASTGLRTPITGGIISSVSGSVIARIRRANPGQIRYIMGAGNLAGAGDWLGLWTSASGTLDASHHVQGGAVQTLVGPVVPLDAWSIVYMEWDGTDVGVALDDGPVIHGTRTAPGGTMTADLHIISYNPNFPFGGLMGAFAAFDGGLADEERIWMRDIDTEWTWQMPLEEQITAYVDTVPSNGTRTGAPVIPLS